MWVLDARNTVMVTFFPVDAQFAGDCLENPVNAVKNVIVGEMQNAKTAFFEIIISIVVFLLDRVVVLAIQLDDQLLLKAAKIGDIVSNGMLPTKTKTCKMGTA